MGQVPSYGIVGDGRLARHFQHYFRLLEIPFKTWSRREAQWTRAALSDSMGDANTILLLIKDDAIESFLQEQEGALQGRTVIHMSGSRFFPGAVGMHPLMTFSEPLYDLETYRTVPFVCDTGRTTFPEVFPGLPNVFYEIPSEKKMLYHALCVMSGNFTTLLWGKVFREMDQQLGIQPEVLLPYLQQTMKNLADLPEVLPLSGPIARNDVETIKNNLRSLEGDPYREVYQSFVNANQGLGGSSEKEKIG